MTRRIAVFLSALLAAGALAVLAPQPAGAVEVCAGEGTATTGSPVFYPGQGPTSQNTFTFAFAIGACVHVPTGTTTKTVTAAGVFLGWCGFSSGKGMTGNGGLFAWIGVGSMLILTGHVVGAVNATPDIPAGESCTAAMGGADKFIVTGAIVLTNCSSLLPIVTEEPLELRRIPAEVPLIGGNEIHIWLNNPCVPDPLTL